MKISKRMQNIKPSAGFALLKLAGDMKAKGEDVISLAIGELQEKTFKPIREAAKKAIDEGFNKYSPSQGRPPLREKLASQASKEFGFEVKPSNIFVGNGCKGVLYALCQCFLEEGDEVLVPAPYWMSYPSIIELSNAKVKIFETSHENNFKITAKELEDSLTKNTRFFLLNSPSNPTGAIYSKQELKALGEVLKKNPQVMVIVDAIYDQIVYEGKISPHILSVCPELKNQVFALNGASKNYVMTGWRLGWLVGPEKAISTLSTFQSQSQSCASTLAQRAFEEGFEACEKDIENLVKKLKEVRDLFYEGLKVIPDIQISSPEGAFYLWIGVKNYLGKKYKDKALKSSKELSLALLDAKKLLCICGEEFGAPGFIRISYVCSKEDSKKAISRIKSFFEELT